MRPTAISEQPTRDYAEAVESSSGSHCTLNRRDALPLGLLLCSLIAMFWRVIFTPAMFFYRDVLRYTYPHAHLIQEACRHATLPYWNPYLNYGEPLLANPNFLFFYPSTLILLLLPIDFAYTMHYIAHFAVAAVGTYWLARHWDQSRAAAFFAAFVFVFSGPVLSLGNLYNHVACAAWIPWALLLTERALEGSSLRPWLLLTAIFSLQFLAAEPFTLFATFGLSFALALYRMGAIRHPLSGPARPIVVRYLLVGCLMVALSSVQLFPALDLLRNSRRGQGLTYVQTSRWSFHPLSLLDMVVPNFFGAPFEAPGSWGWVLNWGHDPYFASVFLGFVPAFFALIGWAAGRNRQRGFVAVAAFTLLLLSFGHATPLFALVYLLLPALQFVRFPVKLLVPAVLLTALLAGWGLDVWRRFENNSFPRRGRILRPLQYLLAGTILVWVVACLAPGWIAAPVARFLVRMNRFTKLDSTLEMTLVQAADAAKFFVTVLRLYLPGLAGLSLGGLTWTLALERRRTWARKATPVVVAFGLAELVLVNYRANPTVPKTFYTYRQPVVAQLRLSTQPYRFYQIGKSFVPAFGSPPVQDFVNFESIPEAAGLSSLALGAFRDRLVLASGSILEGVEGGTSGDVDGSVSPFVYDFWDFVGLAPDPARTDLLLGRTNVKYLVAMNRQPTATRREVAQIFNGSSRPSFLYEERFVTPRAYVALRASWSTDSGEILRRMASADFDSQNDVILSGQSPSGLSSEGSGSAGRVEIVDRQPNTVKLRAELAQPGYLVLLDRFNPNWHATLDGREVPVLRANQMFRAVYAGAGKHEIQFSYHQRGLKLGLALSLFALGLLTILYRLDPRWPLRPA